MLPSNKLGSTRQRSRTASPSRWMEIACISASLPPARLPSTFSTVTPPSSSAASPMRPFRASPRRSRKSTKRSSSLAFRIVESFLSILQPQQACPLPLRPSPPRQVLYLPKVHWPVGLPLSSAARISPPLRNKIRHAISFGRHGFRPRSNPGELSSNRHEQRRQRHCLLPERLARHCARCLQLRSANSANSPKRRAECWR